MLVHEGIWDVYNLYGEANSEIYLWESWNDKQENCSYPLMMQIKIKVPMFYAGTLTEFDNMIYYRIVKSLEENGLAYEYEGSYYWM